MQIDQLTGFSLDWAVARSEGAGSALVETHSRGIVLLLSDATVHCDIGETYAPSTNWTQGGPIIEREKITIRPHAETGGWTASLLTIRDDVLTTIFEEGPTPLIAAMRCYVAASLGDEVEVPDSIGGAA